MSASIASRLLRWHAKNGRHDLPWQHPRTPYRVWVSEVMLQQTQVATVIGYFERFVARFPDVRALADAPLDDVLALWEGLGYYSRARNLHRAARLCGGELPDSLDGLVALPGIGRSTAGAILAQAHGARVAILDGNVKRVLARYHAVDAPIEAPATLRVLWAHAESHLPRKRLADYTQAVMDLGASVCARSAPRCDGCPLAGDCAALRDGLTNLIPRPRAKRALPERSVFWLLHADDAGRVLVERRAPSGVWGGLWSLPEASVAPRGATELASIDHTFTHFRLRARPLLIPAPRARIADDDSRWVTRAESRAIGMPKPVRALLEDFWTEES